jgi:nucleotide-binding universal stress UspA family protein
MSRIQRVLFASDFSSASRPALRSALEIAAALRAELILMHALPVVLPLPGTYMTETAWGAVRRGVVADAEKELARMQRLAHKAGLKATTLVVEGFPAQEIVRVAKAKRVRLIVMGTHGRTGWQRVVMGSVALRVVASAPCPVMTIRGK